MLAVLVDAIQCLAGATGPVRHRARLAADARAWVAECSATWPFSFQRICEALDLDRSRLRTRLLADAPEVPEVDPPQKRRRLPAPEDVGRMITEGQPLRAIARAFGISTSKVSVLSGGLASRMKASRDDEIWRLRALGWTHSALAERFGLSRIRVLRICARGCTARAAVVAFADHVAPDRTGTAE
jgi:hypothetical protein